MPRDINCTRDVHDGSVPADVQKLLVGIGDVLREVFCRVLVRRDELDDGALVWRVGECEGDADALPLDALGLGRDQVEVKALDGNCHDGVDGHVEVIVVALQLDLHFAIDHASKKHAAISI